MTDPTAVRPADAAAGGCLPRKTFDCTWKATDDSPDGEFEMYIAVFGNVDRGGDVIEKGAFRNLDEFVKDGWIAVNHRGSDLPVGYPTAAAQDDVGLKVSGRWHSTPAAQECRTVVRERMAAGKAVKASLGYLTVAESFEKRGGRTIRRIEQLDVFEGSIVNLPMNSSAEVTSAKGADPVPVPETQETPPAEAKSGRALSAANRAKMDAFGDAMDEHHKSLKTLHKAMCATTKEYKAYLKGFDPEEAEEDEEEAVKPRAKSAEAPPAPAPPPDRHEIAKKLAALKPPA